MNTPKKQEMIAEISQLPGAVGMELIKFLKPIALAFNAITRYAYLEQQINLVTPKPAEEKKDEKDDSVGDEAVQKESN